MGGRGEARRGEDKKPRTEGVFRLRRGRTSAVRLPLDSSCT